MFSDQAVPLHEWSHVAAVFGDHETRLYLNGRKVHVGPGTEPQGGTQFVVGCAGLTNPIDHFQGQIRAVRISMGERYTGDFRPQERFSADPADAPNRAILIYDGKHVVNERVLDLSGDWHPAQTGKVVRN
jgi:hypothetical protein